MVKKREIKEKAWDWRMKREGEERVEGDIWSLVEWTLLSYSCGLKAKLQKLWENIHRSSSCSFVFAERKAECKSQTTPVRCLFKERTFSGSLIVWLLLLFVPFRWTLLSFLLKENVNAKINRSDQSSRPLSKKISPVSFIRGTSV